MAKTLTEQEIEDIRAEIRGYENSLTQTDYISHKHADGAMTDEEYEETKAKRAEWRAAINELQAKIGE